MISEPAGVQLLFLPANCKKQRYEYSYIYCIAFSRDGATSVLQTNATKIWWGAISNREPYCKNVARK